MRYQILEEKHQGEWVPAEVLYEAPQGLRVYKPMGRINIHPVDGARLEDFDLSKWQRPFEEMRLGAIGEVADGSSFDPHATLAAASAAPDASTKQARAV